MTNEEKMTPEEAIAEISFLKVAVNKVMEQALEMATKALSQVSEIEENIIKYMKKYPNHVGNTDFWEGFYACRNVVLQLDDEEYAPKEQEPCDDVVSREAVKELIKCGVSTDTYDDVEQVCKWIDALPSVTQKSGKWIDINGIYAECSNCNEEIYITGDFKYCPNCGARMFGEDKE